MIFPSFVIKQYQKPGGRSGRNSFEQGLPPNLGLLTFFERGQCWQDQMYGRDPVLVPVFFAIVLCCLLSLSFVPIAFLPAPPHQGKELGADAQRCRWMLYKWGELSLVGCCLRFHPHLEELPPTRALHLTVTRALLVLGTEHVDGFEGACWSAASAMWFWSVWSEIQQSSSPSNSSSNISQRILALYVFVLLDWNPAPHLFSYLLLMLPFGCAVQLFSQQLEKNSLPLIYQ